MTPTDLHLFALGLAEKMAKQARLHSDEASHLLDIQDSDTERLLKARLILTQQVIYNNIAQMILTTVEEIRNVNERL